MTETQMVISIMTRDRVGIVADVTTAIKDLGGNLADLSQTVLRGYFTMIVIASFPESVSAEQVRAVLSVLDPEAPFEVGIKVPTESLTPEPNVYSSDHYVLTAAGPDEIGLVAAVSTFLREHGINISDLTTRAEEGQYTMILSISLTPEINVGEFKRALQAAVKDVGIRVELQHHDIFRAINEV